MKNSFVICLCLIFTACQTADETKRQQYFAEGAELYKNNCANCHQNDGVGLEGLYPPIVVKGKSKAEIAYLIKFGNNKGAVVNGKTYTQVMPANPNLHSLEIAEIMTYIYNKWGEDNTITSIAEVDSLLQLKR